MQKKKENSRAAPIYKMQMEYEIMQTQIRLLLKEQSDYLLKHIHPTIDILNCSVRSCTYNIVFTCMCFIITCPM